MIIIINNCHTVSLPIWAILYSVLQSAAYVPKERYSSLMVFGVVYASVLGFAAFPFKGPALAILRSYVEASPPYRQQSES